MFVFLNWGIWNVPKRVAHGTHSVPSILSSDFNILASSFDFRLSACLRLHPFAKRRLDTSTRHLMVQNMSNLNLGAFPIHLETLLTKICPRIQFSKKTNKKFLPCWGKMSLLIIFQRKNRFARMKLTLLLWKSKWKERMPWVAILQMSIIAKLATSNVMPYMIWRSTNTPMESNNFPVICASTTLHQGVKCQDTRKDGIRRRQFHVINVILRQFSSVSWKHTKEQNMRILHSPVPNASWLSFLLVDWGDTSRGYTKVWLSHAKNVARSFQPERG